MATVLTSGGEQWAAECMAQTNTNDGRYIDWGTGAGTAAKADTDVFTVSTEARVAGTVSVTGSGATAKYQVVGTMTAAGTRAITNAGNFQSSTGANIIVHGDFATINLATNDAIQFTITIDPS